MRLGIVRDALYLPPAARQREILTARGCVNIREEQGSDFIADRRIRRITADLGAGDELVIQSLGVLSRPQGHCARVLRDILEAGVAISVALSKNEVLAFDGGGQALALVAALAEHERERNASPGKSVHQGGSRNQLSKYQIEYARKLHAEGESLRAIGLLFQMSPNHILDVIGPGPQPGFAGRPAIP